MATYNYYKPTGGFAKIDALAETAYGEGDFVTFEQILNSNYGDYSKCSLSAPAELLPKVVENVYGERMLVLDGLAADLALAPDFAYHPLKRLPTTTVRGRAAAYVDLERRKYDSHTGDYVKTGKTVRVLFWIEEE